MFFLTLFFSSTRCQHFLCCSNFLGVVPLIGHFRVPKTVIFEMRLGARTTFLVKMSFICMRMKNDFHIKGCAPTLVLKQRPGGTRKWSIVAVSFITWRRAWVAERLTPRTPDLEIWGSSLARRAVSLNKELYATLCRPSPRCINGHRPHT